MGSIQLSISLMSRALVINDTVLSCNCLELRTLRLLLAAACLQMSTTHPSKLLEIILDVVDCGGRREAADKDLLGSGDHLWVRSLREGNLGINLGSGGCKEIGWLGCRLQT